MKMNLLAINLEGVRGNINIRIYYDDYDVRADVES
jgi:hypothetical protein